MKRVRLLLIVIVVTLMAVGGCLQTKSEVAVKPVDINLNISGRLELVITDARRQAEVITGEKPKRTVRPEDIGLPPVLKPTSEVVGPDAIRMGRRQTFSYVPVRLFYVAEVSNDRQAQLIQQMAARHPQIETLLASQVVGESHTGTLVPRGSLSASQQALVTAENADRTELYRLEAAKKQTQLDQVITGYYLARLEHVNKGTWVERYNKATGSWEWFQWDR
jgi:uncharacterized protein YdbL (DUF1318 family)